MNQLEKEMLMFPDVTHDDQVDALPRVFREHFFGSGTMNKLKKWLKQNTLARILKNMWRYFSGLWARIGDFIHFWRNGIKFGDAWEGSDRVHKG